MIGEYTTSKTLGTGAFGTVVLGKLKNSETLYAIKAISKQHVIRHRMESQIKKEISIMRDLDHPNIVKIFEVLMSTDYLYIVMEFVSGGELYTKITRGGKLGDRECGKYVHQLCSALSYCHEKNVCHRDIKPQNILINEEDNVFLVDFGFASIMMPAEESSGTNMEGCSRVKSMSTMCGTAAYMAPEILQRERYFGDKADIWSLGIVIYVLLVGLMPFTDGDSKTKYTIPKFVKPQASDFVSKMLIPEPEDRYSATRLLLHPWLKDEKLVNNRLKKEESSDTIDSEHSSDDESDSLDFSVRLVQTFTDKQNILQIVEEVMKTEGWKTRLFEGTLKASRMSGSGIVMVVVDANVEKNLVSVRYANLSKDGNSRIMKDLAEILSKL